MNTNTPLLVVGRLSFPGAIAALLTIAAAGCVAVQPATDTGTGVGPSSLSTASAGSGSTTTAATGPLAYVQDLKPVFDSDCTICHSSSFASGNYSMTTYASIMRDVTPGNANSRLVVWTQPNGTMYRYFTGNRQAKSDMVKQWVVTYAAAQTR
jgi:hypothetical protein